MRLEIPISKGKKQSRVPLRPTSSVHQTKVTGENNAQQPPKVAIKTKINNKTMIEVIT